jgi:hypothetical protein
MRRPAASLLAWSLAALSVAMFVAGVALTVLLSSVAPTAHPPTSIWRGVGNLLSFVPFLAFPIVGALIASKRPKNPIGWICLTTGFFWMLIALGSSTQIPVWDSVAIDALLQWIWVPPVGLLGIYMILLFPDGRPPSRRWRPLAWFSGVVMALVSVVLVISPEHVPGHPGVRNPFGLDGHPAVEHALPVLILLLPLCILASAVSLVWRYRHAGGEAREQIKWVAFAALFVGVAYAILLASGIVFAIEASVWLGFLERTVQLSFAGVPIAIGFAVLKYRLYDIDIIINRALVYAPLTAMLALIYLGGVVGMQAVFRALTGQESTLAVVASTLAIAALFNPLRRRVQSFVDSRFYRNKYDARRTLEAFSLRLRDETDLEALNDDLVGAVAETMQPAHVSLWLQPDPATRRSGEQK